MGRLPANYGQSIDLAKPNYQVPRLDLRRIITVTINPAKLEAGRIQKVRHKPNQDEFWGATTNLKFISKTTNYE